MSDQNQVTGVVLAGGMARRMQQQDKGLQLFKGLPLINYAINAISPLVDQCLISANRNVEQYQQYGFPVITDLNQNFDGPLAGILAAMQHAQYSVLLVMPCDSPFMRTEYLQRLISAMTDDTDICIAVDHERLHPVFMTVKTRLKMNLQAYLDSGERKLQTWLLQHQVKHVDYADISDSLINVNDLQQLAELNHLLSVGRVSGGIKLD